MINLQYHKFKNTNYSQNGLGWMRIHDFQAKLMTKIMAIYMDNLMVSRQKNGTNIGFSILNMIVKVRFQDFWEKVCISISSKNVIFFKHEPEIK